MKYEDVYKLSRKYSPPKIDLRDAEIMDSYGDESYAERAIEHRIPEDVSREDFDFYGWIYSFMNFEDLMFYLYPIASELEKDPDLDCIDSFMYSLDRILPIRMLSLGADDMSAIKLGLRWIWESGGSNNVDWRQCPNLLREIGLSVE